MKDRKLKELLQSYIDQQLCKKDIVKLNEVVDVESATGDTQRLLDKLKKQKAIASQVQGIYPQFEDSEDEFVANTLNYIAKKSNPPRAPLRTAITFGTAIAATMVLIIGIIPFFDSDSTPSKEVITNVSLQSTSKDAVIRVSNQIRTLDYTKNEVSRYMLAKPPASNI